LSRDAFPLTGEKVKLVPFTEADITEDYIGWLNEPEVTRFSNQRFVKHDRSSCRRYFDSFAGSPNLFLSIRRSEDDRPIGTMTAYIAPQHGTADVGILIGDRDAWGKGYGQDAWDTLVAFLLGQPGIRKVTAGTLECNAPMVRLAERSGMELEGRRRAQELVEGKPVDLLYFARFSG
jgi:[ribosomal protein S5]-alanine N-acetyltransferase